MRKIVILFLFVVQCAFAQTANEKISISFDNTKLKDALLQIEQETNYNFLFIEQWLDNKYVTGNYIEKSVPEVLEDIFKNTILNFYITADNRIILTQNSIVYDSLPNNYFGDSNSLTDSVNYNDVESGKNPLFIDNTDNVSAQNIRTIRIGKESASNDANTFNLRGKVTNIVTDKPVADLAIIEQGKNTGTSTDANGNFSIDLPAGENIIVTKALGIQDSKTRIIIYNDGTYNFGVSESFEALDEVVVSGNINRNVEEALTGVTLIEVEKIKEIPLVLGERDILKAAITLPGISAPGEAAAGFNVRGGRADQNLFSLDNAVIYNPTHFFGIFSALNPFSTGSVEIFKGNIPAEFGGRISSVFDIKTKEGNYEKFSGEAAIGPVTSNVVLEIPIIKDKASLLIGGRATYSDWILNLLDDDDLQNSEASFFDGTVKYSHRLNEKNDIELNGYFSRDAFSITSDSIFDYSNRLVSFKWDHKFNDKNTASLILANSGYRFGIEFEDESINDFDLGFRNNETEVKLKVKNIFNEQHTFDYGISSKLYNIDPGNIDPLNSQSQVASLVIPQQRGLESAIFISDNFKVNDKLLINAGIRYSFYFALGEGVQRIYEENQPRNSSTFIREETFDSNEIIETYGGPEVRLSGRYFLSPSLSLKASFNNNIQYIHALSSNTTVSPTDTYTLSDINIEPQRANQFALGLYKNYEGNAYELSLEGYYKRQRNLLDYRVGAQLLLNEAIETEALQGDGRAYGVEFLLKKNLGRLNGWLGYTYSRSFVRLDSEFAEEVVNDGEFFPSNFDKPHDFSLVTNYKFTKRFSASANFVYQTGRPVTFPVGSFEFNNSEFVFFSDRNQFRIPDFYRLDLSFNLEGNHKIKKFAHSFWSFSIYNVLGRNNPFSVFFVTENGEINAFQSSIFSIPVPTLTYNFKF